MQRFIHSKWKKTQALTGDPKINPHVPETSKMNGQSLSSMLSRYGMVYVKPDKGSFGNGVMRVEKTEEGYRYQVGTKAKVFREFDGLFTDLVRATRGRSYLVQKGIRLLKYKGRRFDIRVMVQKSPNGRWESTGYIGRVGDPRKIVTNYHAGGKLVEVKKLMKAHLAAEDWPKFRKKLEKLGVRVAKRLEARYPGIKEIGVDIAVDEGAKPWILEVNTRPDPYIFRAVKDRSVFRKVIRYARAYGRIKMSKN